MQLAPLPQNHRLYHLDLSIPHVMGILNVTPDSFSDGGKHNSKEQAVKRALQMVQEGASIIDIGGESTRPGASIVEIEEEIRRVVPIVETLASLDILISIDTSQPKVIEAAVKAGAHIWNDVRALTVPNALETAVKLDIPVVLMHMRGEPTTMNSFASYHHVIDEVLQELKCRIDVALAKGVQQKNIIIDPGFGFAKDTQHNIDLLKHFTALKSFGYPILSGLSRKRFVGDITDSKDAQERVIGSVVGHLLSVQRGASIVRVHDVKETVDALKMWKAVY